MKKLLLLAWSFSSHGCFLSLFFPLWTINRYITIPGHILKFLCLFALSNLGPWFWTPSFVCISGDESRCQACPFLWTDLGYHPDRSMHLLFRKAVLVCSFIIKSGLGLVLLQTVLILELFWFLCCSWQVQWSVHIHFTISLKHGCTSGLIYLNIMCNMLFV